MKKYRNGDTSEAPSQNYIQLVPSLLTRSLISGFSSRLLLQSCETCLHVLNRHVMYESLTCDALQLYFITWLLANQRISSRQFHRSVFRGMLILRVRKCCLLLLCSWMFTVHISILQAVTSPALNKSI